MRNTPLRPSTVPLERHAPLQPGKRKKRWRVPEYARAVVYARSRGACVMCLAKLGVDPHEASDAAIWMFLRCQKVQPCQQIHHVLPVQSFPELERKRDNLTGICVGCHDEHERARRRIPRWALPVCAVLLAAGVPERVAYLERTYPAERLAA